ncbi:MAG: DUF1992 domain-containing protein [Propionibacteriales bacterium]|nr:DUF1992 domain-containing protein [Propionibacteriales bacterium]
MTERKPPGVSFETWVEKQIREATERGDFDNLPGAGKPIPDVDTPRHEAWIKRTLREEKLPPALPPTLALRKEAEDALAAARNAESETEVRRIVGDVNEKIREAIRLPPAGPPLNLAPFDVDRVVREWHERHPEEQSR